MEVSARKLMRHNTAPLVRWKLAVDKIQEKKLDVTKHAYEL